MTQDEIPFNDWSKNRINFGMKHCTSRHKRYTKDKRVTWISPRLPYWFIKKYLCEEEGAINQLELDGVLFEIYNRVIPDTEEFYVHFGDFQKEQ
jgi:hypothetical protein